MLNATADLPMPLRNSAVFCLTLACSVCLIGYAGEGPPRAQPDSPEEHVRFADSKGWTTPGYRMFLSKESEQKPSLTPAVITRQRFRCGGSQAGNQNTSATLFHLYRVVPKGGDPQFSFSVCSPSSAMGEFLELGLANSDSGASYLWWVTGGGKLYLVPLFESNDCQEVLRRYVEFISGSLRTGSEGKRSNPLASYGLACPSVVVDIRQILGSSSNRSSRVTLSPRWGSPVVRVDGVTEEPQGSMTLRLVNPNLSAVFVLRQIGKKWVLACQGELNWVPDPARAALTEDGAFDEMK